MATLTYSTQAGTLAFGANTAAQTLTLAIPRSRWIRRIRMIGEAVVATVGTSPNALTLPRLLANISLKADGNTSIFDVSGEDLYQINIRDYKTSTLSDGTISAQTTYRQEWVLDSALEPKNDQDFRALIPAFSFNTFDLVCNSNTTLVAAGNGDTVLTSFTVYVVVEEVHMDSNEAASMYGSDLKGLYKILINHKDAAIAVANSGYTGEIDVQPGYVISKLLLRTSDTTTLTAVSVDDLITSYKIDQTGLKGNFVWDEQRWRDSKKQDTMQHSMYLESAMLGSIVYDAISSVGGLDARGMKQGDLKIKYNNTDTSCAYHLTQVNIVVPGN